jgi:eukaryotic-like serine/threonine-protein kinase
VDSREANLSGELVGGKYRLGVVIGSGGMGVVYEAVHTELRSPCAVKVVNRHRADTGESKRLLREARVLAQLRGPHAVRVFDAGRLPDGSPYLVLERLTGEPLSARLAASGALPVAQALSFAWQMCEAVREAHAHGIVHRDLKPSNVFVLSEDFVKVLDFGLALRIDASEQDSTATASCFAGSPRYMSPEQIRASADVSPSTDIWALGVVLFEMLTGRSPFDGAGAGAILASIVADPANRLREFVPSAPPELDRLIADCLEKSPSDRPASPEHIQRRLEALGARPPSGAAQREGPAAPASRSAPPATNEAASTVADAPGPAKVGRWRHRLPWLGLAAALGVVPSLSWLSGRSGPAPASSPPVARAAAWSPVAETGRSGGVPSTSALAGTPPPIASGVPSPRAPPPARQSPHPGAAPTRAREPDVLEAIRTRH